MSAASPTSDDIISAFELRRMGATEWADVMRSAPRERARFIRSAAEHGFKAAQIVWGQMLLDGTGVQRDRAAAHRWFSRAAAIGSPDGINMVGRCHELGWGVPVDHREALGWYRRAAENGSDWGAYNLGCMLLYGDGVPHDPAGALAAFRLSAERGNAKAMGFVGRCHDEGWGTARNGETALSWYERAARGGDCWAQFNLATHLVASGRIEDAAAWLRQSLDSGTPNYLQAAGAALIGSDMPALAEIGGRALARAAQEGAPSADEADRSPGMLQALRKLVRPRSLEPA
ncbi:MAG: Sel1 domain protein repeat-containing protein [Enterovirga sp.]|nr:Sel1 domain protein repeat-containing protein [Enterovirga sp.]